MNGGHEPFPPVRKLPEYRASGFILIAFVGLFIFAGTEIGWLLTAGVFVAAWVLFVIVMPVLFKLWRERNVQG
jgi:hypothetical protein